MRKYFFVFSFFLISTVLYSQKQVQIAGQDSSFQNHVAGDFCLSGSPNILFNTPNGTQYATGLKIKMFLGKRISFDCDFVFGRDYFHTGPGIIGIPMWLFAIRRNSLTIDENSTLSGVLLGAIALISAAEHVAYNIPVSNSMDISPYFSLLRYKYSYPYGDYYNPAFAGEQGSFAVGVEVNKNFGKFILSPYAEYNVGYADHLGGFNTGIYCGYYFRKK